jgi:Fic family protein
MPYIHEHPDWPRLRFDAGALAARLAAVRHAQGRLLGAMGTLGFEQRAAAGLDMLTSDVVKSWAIEGETLDTDAVRSSIAQRLGIEHGGLTPSTREVDGIVETMLDATRRFDEPLTDERLFGWHASLFPTGRSASRRITVGAWRTGAAGPMQVVSGGLGHERVHFEAPSAARVPREMELFLAWFERARSGVPHELEALELGALAGPLDPLLEAGLAHFWFVTIHPFEDGNGRIARAIGDLALARADRSTERFYSLSTQIEAERRDYYDELEFAQRGGLDVTGWLTWYLGCLGRAIEHADTLLARVLAAARVWRHAARFPLSERQRALLARLLAGFEGHLTSSKAAKLLRCSPDTALRDIQALVQWGLLTQNERGGRSTSYRVATFDV